MNTSTDPDYETWHEQWRDAADRVLDDLDRLRDDTTAYARRQSALHRRNPTPASKKRADDAWTLARQRSGPLDALGRPIDPSYAGRAAFEDAWRLATGLLWTHPADDDTPAEHATGNHTGTTLRRSFAGDLPPCSACMDDQLWNEVQTYAAAAHNRRAHR